VRQYYLLIFVLFFQGLSESPPADPVHSSGQGEAVGFHDTLGLSRLGGYFLLIGCVRPNFQTLCASGSKLNSRVVFLAEKAAL
jgi:hypothetical protein